MSKNIFDKKLEICSKEPLTGYNRDGLCMPMDGDVGKHLVCAKLNKKFLDYTEEGGNNLRGVAKEGDKWCICMDWYKKTRTEKKAPSVNLHATHKLAKGLFKKAIDKRSRKEGKGKKRMIKGGRKNKKTQKEFLYNPKNPKKSFDVYIDKNPKDTISMKYTTVNDVKETIKKLERLFKAGKYTHKRIWQVAMILKVRLAAMYKYRNTKYKKAKNIVSRFKLAEKYFKFVGRRSKVDGFKERKGMVFKI